MKNNEIFCKTALGQAEIDSREQELSLIERRVLILLNGEKDVATVARLSLCDETVDVLEGLLERGFIEAVEVDRPPERAEAPQAQSAAEEEIGAREFLCNTLLTYGNRVRVGKLVEEIEAAADTADLKTFVDPWYRAISETPAGMYEADKLRDMLLKLIDAQRAEA